MPRIFFALEQAERLRALSLRDLRQGVIRVTRYTVFLLVLTAFSTYAQNETPASATANDTNAALLLALKTTAGDGAIHCGLVEFDAARAAAFDCAESALNDGKAFSVALRTDPADAHKWSGAARDKSGRLFLIESAADIDKIPSKGQKPITKIRKCSWLKFQDNAASPVVCLRPQK